MKKLNMTTAAAPADDKKSQTVVGTWLYWDEPVSMSSFNTGAETATAVNHDEDLLETLYWEFDNQKNKGENERLAFKTKLRYYALQMLSRDHKE